MKKPNYKSTCSAARMADSHIWHAIDRLASMVTLLGARAPLQLSTKIVSVPYYVYEDGSGERHLIRIGPKARRIQLPDGEWKKVRDIPADQIFQIDGVNPEIPEQLEGDSSDDGDSGESGDDSQGGDSGDDGNESE